MTEWIVLVWTIANPLTGFGGGVVEAKIGRNPPQVFITTSTADFTAKWEELSKWQKEKAQIFIGRKSIASIVLSPSPLPIGDNKDGRCNSVQGWDGGERCALDYWHIGNHQIHKNEGGHRCTATWE